MFQSVTVTNYRGDSLELPLRWPNDAGLLLYKIDGISPGNVDVNYQDYAVLDGGVFNSSRMGTREITLYFYYGFTPQIESARHRAYRYFPVKEKVRLDFLTDERHLYIQGWVEENDTQIFSKQEEGQVTIVCPDPYFYESENTSYVLGSAYPEFEFPFSNESLSEKLICFGETGNRFAYDVNYNGDMEVGAVIRIYFKTDPSNVDGFITIHDANDSIKLVLNIPGIQSSTGVTFEQYGSIVFSSVRGSKDIYYERFGKKRSLIGAFDIVNFPWMYLTPGSNTFAFEMDENYYNDVVITIEHEGAYGGV